MPITSSQITEDSQQADARRWITEEHTDSTGKIWPVSYLATATADIEAIMNARVAHVDARLMAHEISEYLHRIENGENVIGATYTETTQTYRALKFLEWAKQMIANENFQALRFAHLVTDPYSETQINTLLAGTQFEGKADKIKILVDKFREMAVSMDASIIAGENV